MEHGADGQNRQSEMQTKMSAVNDSRFWVADIRQAIPALLVPRSLHHPAHHAPANRKPVSLIVDEGSAGNASKNVD